jgi:hypothetical protein
MTFSEEQSEAQDELNKIHHPSFSRPMREGCDKHELTIEETKQVSIHAPGGIHPLARPCLPLSRPQTEG